MVTDAVNRTRQLQLSPIHGIKPIHAEPRTIPIEQIEVDPTNPGGVSTSRRYERRAPSMLDSFDILGEVINPIVVCQKSVDEPNVYTHVDGFGRLSMLKARGVKDIRAWVYPPLTLEQRICFRQTLNAAQEPFDATSIIHDLRLLAEERHVDLTDRAAVKALVRDLPARVQARERDLLLLTRWHPDVVTRMGEEVMGEEEVIGLDQLRSLTHLLDAIKKTHPTVMEKAGGEAETSKTLAEAFYSRRFAEGMRSQEGIRKATIATKVLPADDPAVADFLGGTLKLTALIAAGIAAHQDSDESENVRDVIVSACQALTQAVIDVDAQALSDQENRALSRTFKVLESVLAG